MKQLLLVLFMFSACAAMASEEDSTKTVHHKKELTKEEREKRAAVEKKFSKFSKDRFAIDLLGNNWIYDKNGPGFNGLQTKWYSRGINIYFYYDFRIKNSRVSIAPGIGYGSSNIYSRHKLVEDSVGSHFEPLLNSGDYKVNKIALQYLEIPLELRIKTDPDKLDQCWKFAVGFKAGFRVDAHTKTKTTTGGVTKVDVERRFPDFSLFRMGPTIRIGYSSFNITAYYGILGVFKPGKGPKANEFSVGISFNGL
jgi:hypothetical protein